MRFSKRLINEIPLEKRDVILNKIESFEQILLEARSFSNIPKGFWIRNVKGTDIYKFRVSSGDRILFKYEKINGIEGVVFLNYCKHDDQIRVAKNIKGNIDFIDFEIDKGEYIEDKFDKEIDEYIKSEEYELLDEIKGSLIEDEYISLFIDEENLANINYLSIEQYDCLKNLNIPTLVLGCAGSGKSIVAKRKVIMNNILNINTAYITCSNLLVNQVEKMCSELNSENIQFFTFRSLCLEILNVEKNIVGFDTFTNWILNNNSIDIGDLDLRQIWIEINTKIKGNIYNKNLVNMITEKEYINLEDNIYDLKNKKNIYDIAKKYQNWIERNNYFDDNDLAYEVLKYSQENKINKFDYIIYDEFQDLSEKQLLVLVTLLNNPKNLMILGDLNQNINIEECNIKYLKNLIYEKNLKIDEKFIYKNYRNGLGIVNWINKLHKIRNTKFKSREKIFEIDEQYIKEGEKPNLIHKMKNENTFFDKVDKDVKSAVVVSDQVEKKVLKDAGYKTGRIFTLDEIRGLEYDNIYCYNIMTHFKDIWNIIMNSNEKFSDIYSIYFNIIYIASTRAKKELYFIESEVTELEKEMKDYCKELKDEQECIRSISVSQDLNDWLIEAQNLEKAGKYIQAADAYEKANREFDAEVCLKAAEMNIDYENYEKYTTFLVIISDSISGNIDAHKIKESLDLIYKLYGVRTFGAIKSRFNRKDVSGGYGFLNYFSIDSDNSYIASTIIKNLDKNKMNSNKITLELCFYKNNEPIKMDLVLKNGNYDLKVEFLKNNIYIKECINNFERDLAKFLDEYSKIHYGTIGIDPNKMHPRKLRMQNKLENKSSEDILNQIFNE